MRLGKRYFDYAATTPLDKAVFAAMQPYLTIHYGNASSVHVFGRQARTAVDTARQQAAAFLNCSPHNIIFTSGATESNNTVLKGLLRAGDHLVTTAIEHPSIIAVAKHLERLGVEVTYIEPESNGIVSIEAVIAAIKDHTKLVSVMYVNNEIGSIQPIAQIGAAIRQLNTEQKQRVFFHTDATQAAQYLPMGVRELGVDFLSLSAHKCYGPKGVGLLYFQPSVLSQKLLDGGSQEYNIRAGTLNTPGIVGLGAALEQLKQEKLFTHVSSLKKYFIAQLSALSEKVVVNSGENSSPHIIHLTIPGHDAQTLLIALDQKGFAVPAGAACAAGGQVDSHVLAAIGLSQEKARQSLRISLGKYTQKQDVTALVRSLAELL